MRCVQCSYSMLLLLVHRNDLSGGFVLQSWLGCQISTPQKGMCEKLDGCIL